MRICAIISVLFLLVGCSDEELHSIPFLFQGDWVEISEEIDWKVEHTSNLPKHNWYSTCKNLRTCVCTILYNIYVKLHVATYNMWPYIYIYVWPHIHVVCIKYYNKMLHVLLYYLQYDLLQINWNYWKKIKSFSPRVVIITCFYCGSKVCVPSIRYYFTSR